MKYSALLTLALLACGANFGDPDADAERWNASAEPAPESVGDEAPTPSSGTELGEAGSDMGTAQLAQTAAFQLGCYASNNDCQIQSIQFQFQQGFTCQCVIDANCDIESPIGLFCTFGSD